MNGYLTLPRRHVFLRSGQPISSPQKQTRAAVKSVVISGETKYPVGREMPSLPTYRSMFWIQSFFTLTSSVFFSLLPPPPHFLLSSLVFSSHSFRRRSPLYSNIISISQMMYDRFVQSSQENIMWSILSKLWGFLWNFYGIEISGYGKYWKMLEKKGFVFIIY